MCSKDDAIVIIIARYSYTESIKRCHDPYGTQNTKENLTREMWSMLERKRAGRAISEGSFFGVDALELRLGKRLQGERM